MLALLDCVPAYCGHADSPFGDCGGTVRQSLRWILHFEWRTSRREVEDYLDSGQLIPGACRHLRADLSEERITAIKINGYRASFAIHIAVSIFRHSVTRMLRPCGLAIRGLQRDRSSKSTLDHALSVADFSPRG